MAITDRPHRSRLGTTLKSLPAGSLAALFIQLAAGCAGSPPPPPGVAGQPPPQDEPCACSKTAPSSTPAESNAESDSR